MSVPDYRVDGRIAHLTLNRPERANGLTSQLIEALAATVEPPDPAAVGPPVRSSSEPEVRLPRG